MRSPLSSLGQPVEGNSGETLWTWRPCDAVRGLQVASFGAPLLNHLHLGVARTVSARRATGFRRYPHLEDHPQLDAHVGAELSQLLALVQRLLRRTRTQVLQKDTNASVATHRAVQVRAIKHLLLTFLQLRYKLFVRFVAHSCLIHV